MYFWEHAKQPSSIWLQTFQPYLYIFWQINYANEFHYKSAKIIY